MARVLLVEDHDDVRAVLSETLSAASFEVVEARTGAEAIALAAEELDRIDALVTDRRLPGAGGLEVIRRLSERKPGLRSILISGFCADLAGRDLVCLPKPFRGTELVERLSDLLGQDRPGANAPLPHVPAAEAPELPGATLWHGR